MVDGKITGAGIEGAVDYMQATKQRIFAAVTEGVTEGMEMLDATIAGKLQGNPVVSRTGQLLEAVLAGVKVRTTATTVVGTVTPDTHDNRNLAEWLEEGHRLPGQRMRKFEAANIRKHAFSAQDVQRYLAGARVPARPFMDPSVQETESPIMLLIQQKISEAVE